MPNQSLLGTVRMKQLCEPFGYLLYFEQGIELPFNGFNFFCLQKWQRGLQNMLIEVAGDCRINIAHGVL